MPVPLLPFAFVLVGLFADVEPLDRIAGIVGDKPVFLSELRRRARPHFYRIDYMGGDAKQREAAKKETLRQVLDRIVEERIEAAEADRAHITVDDAEITNGIKMVAEQAKLTPAELVAEAKKQGMTEADYKEEIRRQILEGKLVQLRVRGRVKVTEADARAVYATWVKEQTGADAPVDLRILVLGLPAKATEDEKKAKEALAARIASQAKSGADFCTLVTTHSEDPTTKANCGSRGPMPRSMLLADIAKATASLEPGKTADPVFFTDPTGARGYLVIQRAPGAPPAVAPFEKVKEQMMSRAMTEATERARKQWLEELRKPVYVEVKP